MDAVRRRQSSEFKAKVAMEAVNRQKIFSELAIEFAVHTL